MSELKPCWKCGSPGKVEENGGYMFAVCANVRCSNNDSWGVDIGTWNRGGITEVQELRARVAELTGEVAIQNELMQEMVYTESVARRKELAGGDA